jgi:CPA1 family monovalent cation:H+ antiporter
MLELAIFVVLIAATALFVQQKLGVPTPITIIASVVLVSLSGHRPIEISDQTFDHLVFLMLPILICVDAMMLRWDELKRNALSLFYIAGIMIVLSVGLAIMVNRHILPDYHLTAPAVAALFCMILATDPVSVSAVFGRSHLPHNLKVLAEGESLFNDASALIVFSIALVYMGHGPEHVADNPTLYAVKMVVGALGIGLVVGYVGLIALRYIHDAMTETMIVLLMALGAFAIAEHYHASGIFAVIVAILFANNIITKRLSSELENAVEDTGERGRTIGKIIPRFDNMIKDSYAYQVVIGNIQFIAIIASTVLFITMANLINLQLLVKYWGEIMAVFVGSTIIRMVMLGGFAWMSQRTDKVVTIPLHWWKVLTAAGVKGAFSLLMLHMIPRDFEYLELFEAIVVGNVLLSTFLYPAVLILIIKTYKDVFEAEYKADHLRIED